LASVASRFSPLNYGFSIELIFNPLVWDNVTNFRVFNEDDRITEFLTNARTFKDVFINYEENKRVLQKYRDGTDNLKSNPMLKEVLTLKQLFNLYRRFGKKINVKTNIPYEPWVSQLGY